MSLIRGYAAMGPSAADSAATISSFMLWAASTADCSASRCCSPENRIQRQYGEHGRLAIEGVARQVSQQDRENISG